MKKIILHVGAERTGSTLLQTFFALNKEKLKKYNFFYWDKKDFIEKQKKGINTGGNGRFIIKAIKNKQDLESILKCYINNGLNLIISGEMLAKLNYENLKFIYEFYNRMGYRVFALYYVRAFIDFILSRHHQSLKQEKKEKILYERNFLFEGNGIKITFLDEIKKLDKIFGKNFLIVKNYDKNKNNLIKDFLLNILEIDNTEDFIFPNKKVNRSFTSLELFLIKKFNEILENNEQIKFVSDSFINNFPDLKPDYEITEKELDFVKAMYSKDLEEINEKYLKDNEKPLMLFTENVRVVNNLEKYKLDEFQARILVLIGEIIKKLQKEKII